MRFHYGYDSYRGRSKSRNILMGLIVFLLIVLILVVAAFFLLQGHIYYGDDGKAHIDLPGFLQHDTSPAPEAFPSPEVVVVTPEPTATPTPTAAPGSFAGALFYPVELPRSALTDGTAVQAVADAEGNAALFDMKDDEGTLGYVSALPRAISAGASAAEPGLNDAIRALNDTEGLYTVARVACFRDNLAPKMDNTLALRSPIGNWRDKEVIRWLSPAVEEARAYVVGICQELAELGFDEIWLDYAAFPTTKQGTLGNLMTGERYDPELLTDSVERFYQEVRDVLADYPDVKVGISTSSALLAGGEDESGQTTELLGQYAHRIYVPGPEDEATARAYDSALKAMSPEGTLQTLFTTPAYTPELSSSYAPLGGGRLLS